MLSITAAFAESNDILYSYDYNRYYTQTNDVVVGGGYQYKVNNYKFQNQTNLDYFDKRTASSGFSAEAVERKTKYSFYENVDYLTRELSLNEVTYKINTITLRAGATKDYFVPLTLYAATLSVGGGVVGKLDWFSEKQTIYNDFSISMGISLKAQSVLHVSSDEGKINIFVSYQPDIFLINSTKSGVFEITKSFVLDQSITGGIQIRLL